MDKKSGTIRRKILKGIALAGSSIMLPNAIRAEKENGYEKPEKKLRIAHITDVHIRPEENAPERFGKCISEIKKHDVDFFLNGGDTIFAADYNDITRERVNVQWDIWKAARKQFSEYEIYSCLGNHDMWWAAPNKKDPMYGKNHAIKQLNMPAAYYSFDKSGWHFIVLDSNNEGGGALGEEQLKWLSEELRALPVEASILVMSHYPILSASTHAVGGNHKDSLPITKLFHNHSDKNIHCISGHVHLLDTAVYNNVHYYCNGAISGFWWGEGDKDSAGKYWYHEIPPGYTIIDLYENGTIKNKYYPHTY